MDITSSTVSGAFKSDTFSLNPLNRACFPWLATLASQYDQWDPNGIVLEFVSTSSDFNAVGQSLGAVVMATDYDVADAPYASKQVMENADFSCSTKPSQNLTHGIECAKSERILGVMYTQEHTNPQFAALGNFQIATSGVTATNIKLGELWISYDISFFKKQLNSTLGLMTLAFSSAVPIGIGMLGNAQIVINKQGGFIADATNVFFPPTIEQGKFLMVYSMLSLTTTESYAPIGTNCTVISNKAVQVGLAVVTYATIKVTAQVASVAIAGTKLTNTGQIEFKIIECPQSFSSS
jgi:hypothetical protein